MMNFVFCFFISFSQANDRPSPTRERARGKENVFGHVTYNQEPNRLLLQLISLLKFFVFVSDFRNNEERPSITTIFNDKLLGSRFIFSKFWAILKMFDQVKLIKRERERTCEIPLKDKMVGWCGYIKAKSTISALTLATDLSQNIRSKKFSNQACNHKCVVYLISASDPECLMNICRLQSQQVRQVINPLRNTVLSWLGSILGWSYGCNSPGAAPPDVVNR